MTRRRMTWNERKASAPPATPGYLEGTEHPAYGQEDPEADQYMNGDPSSWAEDPTVGPYPNSAAPATPGYEGPQGHPATDPKHYFPAGAAKSASRNLRAAMEHKASKCIRIATRMLGRKASVDAIEDQALDLMNLSDRQIQAMLTRIAEEGPEANYTLTEPRTSGDLLADDLMIDDEDVIVPASEDDDLEAEALFAEMVEGSKFAKKSEDDVEADEEALLAEMVKEEKKASLRSRAAKKSEDEAKPEVKEDATEEDAAKKAAHFKRLASFWSKKAGEEVEEEVEEKVEEAPAKKASLRRRADQNAPNAADEAKLAEMLEEESKKAAKKSEGEEPDGDEATAEEEALLADMEKEESKKAAKKSEDAEEVEESEESDEEEKAEDGEDEGADKKAFDETFLGDSFDSDLGDPMMEEELFVDDPMALMDDAGVSDDEMALLYGSKFAKVKSAKKSEDEAEEAEEPKEEAKTAAARTAAAKRNAALKPQPRLASTGVKTLGSVSKVASNEVNDLSKLWESAPDVSKIFGN